MTRKIVLTALVFVLAGFAIFGAGMASDLNEVSLPRAIAADSLCPVARCASGSCHSYGNVPEPDGVSEMVCPKVGCSSVECHAWQTLTTKYFQPSEASLNVWVLAPAVLVLGLVLLVTRL